MSRIRLSHAPGSGKLHQTNLRRLVSVLRRRLPLEHHARAGFQNGGRNDVTILPKDLSHPEFFAKNRVYHDEHISAVTYFVCSFPNALISISTPEGKSILVSASMVCVVGSRISTRRLWVRISNCSRDFLSLCGERRTQYLFLMVGKGIGPATCAPVRFAVETISAADWSS